MMFITCFGRIRPAPDWEQVFHRRPNSVRCDLGNSTIGSNHGIVLGIYVPALLREASVEHSKPLSRHCALRG